MAVKGCLSRSRSKPRFAAVMGILLIAVVFFSGCIDQPSTTLLTTTTIIQPTTTSTTQSQQHCDDFDYFDYCYNGSTCQAIKPTADLTCCQCVPVQVSTSTTTIQPTTIVSTTTIPTTTTTTPMIEPEPITFSGTGQEATSKFKLEKGLSIFEMTHDGSHNFIVWLLDSNGNNVELLANEIGSFDGSTAVGIVTAGYYLLDINADGGWSVNIQQPRPSSAPKIPTTLTGSGNTASEMFYLDAGLVRFGMTHDGSHNFIVWLLDSKGNNEELLVNEIGSFDGSKAIGVTKSGIYLLDISADGNWQISIE